MTDMELKFDHSKLFYPYVINYITSLHGNLELMSRYFYVKIEKAIADEHSLEDVIKHYAGEDPKYIKFIQDILDSNIKPTVLLGQLTLKSEQRKNHIEISISEIAKDFVNNHEYLLPFQIRASGMLLIMAYEASLAVKYDKTDPLWNFLYHCRNAIAHDGKFNIDERGKKRLPAKWGGYRVILKFSNQ